ncbi:MAG: transcriptional repressor [Holophagaceae bacterium]|nr:transcriptional repressor [Holophagaceae bacterium]
MGIPHRPRGAIKTQSDKHPAAKALHSVGMKVTPQRQGILSVLDFARRPLSVEEISQRLSEPRPGLSTIYRNLERFIQEGWAESMPGSDQIMRFLKCHSGAHHHHIQCEECGCVVEVGACEIEPLLREAKDLGGFTITRHRLQLFGLCPTCLVKPQIG